MQEHHNVAAEIAPIRAALPPALAALESFPQFILWKAEPKRQTPDGRAASAADLRRAGYVENQINALPVAEGKPDKVPMSPATLCAGDPHAPVNWMPYAQAAALAAGLGESYGVGFVLTAADPFVCVDVDACREGESWSELAQSVGSRLSGAACERSINGNGLHFWSRYSGAPFHGRKNTALHVEIYSQKRFIALGHVGGATGNASTDCTAALDALRVELFADAGDGPAGRAEWTAEPLGGQPLADDEALIAAAIRAVSATAVLTDGLRFADLWTADADALARAFPVDGSRADGSPYDASSADFSLAARLAWWTGGDCERMQRLMLQSELRRPDKWERADYLPATILNAVRLQAAKNSGQGEWYTGGAAPAAPGPSPAASGDSAAVPAVPLHATVKPGELSAATMIAQGHGGEHVYAVDSATWYHRAPGKLPRFDNKALRLGQRIQHYMSANNLQRGSSVNGILTHLRIMLKDYEPWNVEPELCGLPDDRVLDIRTGLARDALPSDRISRRLSTVPESGTPETWLRVLGETHAGKPDRAEIIHYLQVFLGYCLTGITSAQRFLFIVGPPASGKGTFVSTLARIWNTLDGDGYATAIPSDALLDGRSQHAQWLTLFDGPRLAIVGESNNDSADYRGRAWRLGDLKMLTGGEPISANRMRQNSYTFEPSAKLIIASNNVPDMRRFDEALKRRLVLVRCNNAVAAADRDEWLQQKLQAEDGQVLTWALEGAREYLHNEKLPPLPASMRTDRDEYLEQQDTFGEFLKACFTDVPGAFVPTTQLRAAHTLWLAENGDTVRWSDGMRYAELNRREQYRPDTQRINGTLCRGFLGLTAREITQ